MRPIDRALHGHLDRVVRLAFRHAHVDGENVELPACKRRREVDAWPAKTLRAPRREQAVATCVGLIGARA